MHKHLQSWSIVEWPMAAIPRVEGGEGLKHQKRERKAANE
jgi:hypothetical protein